MRGREGRGERESRRRQKEGGREGRGGGGGGGREKGGEGGRDDVISTNCIEGSSPAVLSALHQPILVLPAEVGQAFYRLPGIVHRPGRQ